MAWPRGSCNASNAPAGAMADGKRPRFPVPRPDDELTPVMRLLDQQLLLADEPEPPMPTVEGWPVEVRIREPISTHELTAAGANGEEEIDACHLPAPNIHVLARHNACSMALLVEKHVSFLRSLPTRTNARLKFRRGLPLSSSLII